MTTEQYKAIARREAEQFEGKGNAAVGDEVFAPGYRLHFPGFPEMDQAGHAQVISAFHAAFPDMTIGVEFQVAEGDRVANHISLRGTHQGDFQGIPPTGKQVSITGSNIMRFENGRIAEMWGNLDVLGMMQQLGVVPA